MAKLHWLISPIQRHAFIMYILISKDPFRHITAASTYSPVKIALPITALRNKSSEGLLGVLVSKFGCSTVTTTDRRSYFEVAISSLIETFGSRHLRATAYQLQAKDWMARFHQQLRAALQAGPLALERSSANSSFEPSEIFKKNASHNKRACIWVHALLPRSPRKFASFRLALYGLNQSPSSTVS